MKFKIAVLAVFVVCLGQIELLKTESAVLQKEYIPGTKPRLRVISVENDTNGLEFKVFSGYQSLVGLALPLSTLDLIDYDGSLGLDLNRKEPLIIRCSKGSFRTVYIEDGHNASGRAEEGWEGPFFVKMWFPYPHVSDSSKNHVRYIVKKGEIGKIGVKIGNQGDYRLVALENVKFIHSEDKAKTIEEEDEE